MDELTKTAHTSTQRSPQGIIVLVDVLLFTLVNGTLSVLLHKRPAEPFAGALALPGGYVRPQEDKTTLAAAKRVLKQKIGVDAPYLEQLKTYSGSDRDPGGWSVSVAYFALIAREEAEAADQTGVWKAVDGALRLAFDHRTMVADAVERIRNKSAYSSLPAFLAGPVFTLGQLQKIYESVLGVPLEKVTFRRRIEEIGAIEAVEGAMVTGRRSRPAQLYRIKPEHRSTLGIMARGFNGR